VSNDNVFSLEKFRSKLPPDAKPSKAVPRKRPLSDETFVRIPYRRVTELYGPLSAASYAVLIELDHQHFKARGKNPLKLTNQTDLAAAGMPRNTKARALRELQDVGRITLQKEWKGAFVVTLSWHPVVL
jgi:hypothetical protein